MWDTVGVFLRSWGVSILRRGVGRGKPPEKDVYELEGTFSRDSGRGELSLSKQWATTEVPPAAQETRGRVDQDGGWLTCFGTHEAEI